VIDWAASLGSPELYLVIALLAFAETAVFADVVVPGEVGMLVVAAAGASAGLSWPALVVCAAVGAALGDTVSFGIGRRWGSRVIGWQRRRGGRGSAAVDRAVKTVADRGGPAVLVGRWIGVLRAVVPVVAGSGCMPLRRFLGWNVVASITWAGVVVSLGYHVGPAASRFVQRAGWAAAALLVAAGVWWWLARKRRRTGPGAESRLRTEARL